jgi:hypothetical protein
MNEYSAVSVLHPLNLIFILVKRKKSQVDKLAEKYRGRISESLPKKEKI